MGVFFFLFLPLLYLSLAQLAQESDKILDSLLNPFAVFSGCLACDQFLPCSFKFQVLFCYIKQTKRYICYGSILKSVSYFETSFFFFLRLVLFFTNWFIFSNLFNFFKHNSFAFLIILLLHEHIFKLNLPGSIFSKRL